MQEDDNEDERCGGVGASSLSCACSSRTQDRFYSHVQGTEISVQSAGVSMTWPDLYYFSANEITIHFRNPVGNTFSTAFADVLQCTRRPRLDCELVVVTTVLQSVDTLVPPSAGPNTSANAAPLTTCFYAIVNRPTAGLTHQAGHLQRPPD
jgi:hypothetical protein